MSDEPESTAVCDTQVRGRWVEPEGSYVNPARRFCAYCGRPIARRYREVERRGAVRRYRVPEHAASDATYPI